MGRCFLHGNNNSDSEKSSIIITAPAGSSVRLYSDSGYDRTKSVDAKNLLDIDAYMASVNSADRGTIFWDEDGFTLSALDDDCYTKYGPDLYTVEVDPNTVYTLSWEAYGDPPTFGGVVVFMYDKTGSQLNYYSVSNKQEKLTFETPANTVKVSFRFGVQTAGGSCFYSNLQLEKGGIKTKYVRHNSCKFDGLNLSGYHAVASQNGEQLRIDKYIPRIGVYYWDISGGESLTQLERVQKQLADLQSQIADMDASYKEGVNSV